MLKFFALVVICIALLFNPAQALWVGTMNATCSDSNSNNIMISGTWVSTSFESSYLYGSWQAVMNSSPYICSGDLSTDPSTVMLTGFCTSGFKVNLVLDNFRSSSQGSMSGSILDEAQMNSYSCSGIRADGARPFMNIASLKNTLMNERAKIAHSDGNTH